MRPHLLIGAACALGALSGAPAASAANGALAQLPGKAACVSNDAYDGSPGLCRQAVGVDGVQSVAVSPDGRSLYTAAIQSSAVAAFARDASTGLPTQITGGGGCISEAVTAGCTTGAGLAGTDWVTVSPDGADVYATSTTSQAVDVFSRDPSTGSLSQLAGPSGCISSSASETSCTPGRALRGAAAVSVSPDGSAAYVASFSAGAVAIFSRGANGALSQLGGAAGCLTDGPTSAGCTVVGHLNGAADVAVSPDGSFVYVAARFSQAVTVYARNATTGALTRVAGTSGCVSQTPSASCAQASGMRGPNSIAFSPDGSIVYVGNFTAGQGAANDTVAVFSRNSGTGALTEQECLSGTPGGDPACAAEPALGGNFAVTTSPDGSYLYVTAYQSHAVSAFSTSHSGLVTPLPGLSACVSETGSGGSCARGVGLSQPHQTVLSPDGAFAYLVANQSDVIDVFATVVPSTEPPVNTSLPVISGPPTIGTTLSATAGAWSGTQSGYAYQWQICDAGAANCAPIAGQSGYVLSGAPFSASYSLSGGDLGHSIRIVLTAVNSAGSTTVSSAPTRSITVAPPVTVPPPVSTRAPTIAGVPRVGRTLTATKGDWSGQPIAYAYQWLACNSAGLACVAIRGATAPRLVVGWADAGRRLRISVTARGAGGPTSAASKPTAPIGRPVAVMTCAAAQGKQLTCKVRVAAGSGPSRGLRATLSRGRAIYARGVRTALSGSRLRLVMTELRPLSHGHYTLSIRYRSGHGTRRQRLTLSVV